MLSAGRHKLSRLVLLLLVGGLALLGIWALGIVQLGPREPSPSVSEKTAPADDTSVFNTYAGSQSCRDCHTKAFDLWQSSHHALAERPVDPVADKAAFDPPHEIKHGTQTAKTQCTNGRCELVTAGADGKVQPFVAERVIAVDPLYQFLVPGVGGRFQVTELAVATKSKEWFDVFGNEDRRPGEWGHWTGRGMTWNSMCAGCHNTRVRKNYNQETDTYRTAMAERGVGCEACHGPMAQHVAWQKEHAQATARPKDPFLTPFTGDTYLSVCGACHARRSDLTGDFKPGDQFLDHFSPTIPDETDIYHSDGQVRDEDFEYVSFLGSRMYGMGVRCTHCHEPHGGKPRATGNALCLQCHAGKVDPVAHSHHKADTPGALCVDCHMPQTPYMQRHLRRDHGLTIPDPALTKLTLPAQPVGQAFLPVGPGAIPNACSRCHKDKSLDWAIDYATQWYGQKLNRHTQTRARAIVKARAGSDDAPGALLKFARAENNVLWKSVAATLLGGFSGRDDVRTSLLEDTRNPAPLVRAMAVRALSASAGLPPVRATLQKLLDDPVRLVRVEAAWALHADVKLDTAAGRDLLTFLNQNADQPGGLLQMAVLHVDRDNLGAAMPLFRKAISWDTHSPQLRQSYATALAKAGDNAEAVRQLETACRTEPRNALLRYDLGLALGESGDMPRALQAFKDAVAIEPRFARAWYNLGLASAHAGNPADAIESLQKAEAVEPKNPDFSYALATVYFNTGKLPEARAAAERSLHASNNTYRPAAELLQRLNQPQQ